jgi:selenocysteine lyase/cysteine desulfurase
VTNLVEGPFDAERVRNLREVLAASGAGIYLATHLAGPIPAESMAASRESDDMELRVGRVGPDRDDDLLQRDREARAVVAAALQAAPDRTAIVHGAAEGARLIALEALREAEAGRHAGTVLVGDHHPTVAAALRGVAAATGSHVTTADTDATDLPPTTLVAIAHVGANGSLVDVPRLATLARDAGARVLLDASLTCGAIPVEVAALGVDAIVTDAHRWLLGPEATAIAWLGPAFREDAPQAIHAASAPFARGALVALARSVGWLLMYAELPWILARTGMLTERLLDRLSAIDRVRVLTARDRHAALIAFRIAGWSAEQAADELSRSVFAILEADAEHDQVRIGPGAWNREEELDRFVERVAEIAAHTPETLPRRPTLTVLTAPSESDA